MKNASPYTGKWLREVFPEQTKSVKSILIWSLIFIADIALVFWGAVKLGLDFSSISYQFSRVLVGVIIAAALLLFWAETAIYNKLLLSYRKTLE